MKDKIQNAFGQIQAEVEIKSKTKDFIYAKTNGYRKGRGIGYKGLISALACMALLILAGRGIYFTPTVEISIDINPSVELGVNRFDRIISFESYNEDGKELLDSLHLRFMNYSEAVAKIMENEKILSLLSGGGVMTIAVVGEEAGESPQSEEILANLRTCTAGRKNTYCYYAHGEDVEKAHEAGLSYGKYRAFLELQMLDPDVTLEEVQNMTMHEIKERIRSLSGIPREERQHRGKAESNGRSSQRQDKNHGRRGRGQGNGQGPSGLGQGRAHGRGR